MILSGKRLREFGIDQFLGSDRMGSSSPFPGLDSSIRTDPILPPPCLLKFYSRIVNEFTLISIATPITQSGTGTRVEKRL
jgi:hypothetical protein